MGTRGDMQLYFAGIRAEICSPPDDDQGTDCSARWRIAGKEGLRYLFDACECVERTFVCALCEQREAERFAGERGFCSLCWPHRDLCGAKPEEEDRCGCGAIAEHYRQDGTPCCAIHYPDEQEVKNVVETS